MSSKESLEELTHAEYWDKRYTDKAESEPNYDWLRSFETIKPFFQKHLPKPEEAQQLSILQLGCGNSVRVMNSNQD